MHSFVRPGSHVVLRLPSETLKVVEVIPNTIIHIGKYGAFPADLLLGRPYYSTYDILDSRDEEGKIRLRRVPASELNAETLAEDTTPSESRAEPEDAANGSSFDIVAEDGSVIMKNNRLTVDDVSRQTLSMEEIEELKKSSTGSGKDIIAKIMKSHTNLDEKTTFSLAKYTLRKAKKYMRRFTVLPMDVGRAMQWMATEKEASRIMEIREEILGLIAAWSNVHFGGAARSIANENVMGQVGGGRWLVVDETGGLLVATMAERMGILYSPEDDEKYVEHGSFISTGEQDVSMQDASPTVGQDEAQSHAEDQDETNPSKQARHRSDLASTNTIHVLHANAQPNLSLLKYFSYDTNNPSPTHPLHTHVKPVSWLQLLDPEADTTYAEPDLVSPSELEKWKSGKRGTYYKKRRRWERCKSMVDETRAGGFDGLIVASSMEASTILAHTVPLVRGAGHVVVYSPTIEPLTTLLDLYSRERKAAYLALLDKSPDSTVEDDDFPVDPRLLLAPSLQTSRTRPWQVLPGRTHPLMTSPGGAEGYLFTARRVIPVEGRVEARGNFAKKRKIG